MNDVPYGCFAKTEFLGQPIERPSFGERKANRADYVFRSPGSSVLLAAANTMGLGESAIPISSGPAMGAGVGTVTLPASEAVRRCDGKMPVASGQSAFCCGVAGIVSVSSEEQMSGIDARRIVAAMADDHTVRDSPVGETPRNTMGTVDLAINSESTVVIAEPSSGPEPTFVGTGLGDIRPEMSLLGDGKGRDDTICSSHVGLQLGHRGQGRQVLVASVRPASLYAIGRG
jgi:hypothetical protein